MIIRSLRRSRGYLLSLLGAFILLYFGSVQLADAAIMNQVQSGPPGIHPSDPHHFAINGATWYPAGYYPSLGALTSDQTDYTNYYKNLIDNQAAAGINYFRTIFTMGQPYGDTITVYQRTGPGLATDGHLRFDLTKFNQAYLTYWRNVVTYALSKNVVVQLCIIDGWHTKAQVVENDGPGYVWGMQSDFYYWSNNINGVSTPTAADWFNTSNSVYGYQQALVRKVVDTLGDLPNIVWEIGNETGGRTSWELQVANYLTSYEQSLGVATHIVMPRDLPGHEFVAGHCSNDPASTHTGLVSAYSQNRPLITDNDCIGADTPTVRRQKAWAALTAGAHIDLFHFDALEASVLNSQDVADGMRYIAYTNRFLSDLNIDLAGLAPSDSSVSKGWCLSRAGSQYIVYLISGGSTSIQGLTAPFVATWFNPRTGASQGAPGGPSFNAPDGNDWVLYVRKTNGGDTNPPTISITTPTNGQTLAGQAQVSATAIDDVGVANVQFSLDGASIGSVALAPYTINLDTVKVANGTHSLTATARDAQGNTTSSNAVSVAVQNVGTSAPFFSPIRINAGGPTIYDAAGRAWSMDTGSPAGMSYGVTSAISNTNTPALYQTSRWNPNTLDYNFAVPNGSYTVTLKFAETYFNTSGRRVFDVSINGRTVLPKFDIFGQAGAANFAIDRSFAVSVTNGQIAIHMAASVQNPTINGIEITQATGILVNAGGSAYTDTTGNTWAADYGYNTGTVYRTSSNIANTVDQMLYQGSRWSNTTLNYLFAVPNGDYTVTLKFAELYFTQPGQRVFNVAINGQPVLNGFDIFKEAGGVNRAVDRSFPVAVQNGRISIDFAATANHPSINAIQID